MNSILQQLQRETESLTSIKGVPKLPNGKDIIQLEILSAGMPLNEDMLAQETKASLPQPVFTKQSPYPATLESFKILSGKKGDGDAVYEVTLGIETMNWKYKSGDSFGIVCRNKPTIVDSLLHLLGLERSTVLKFASPRSSKNAHVEQCSAFDLFSSYVDLFAMPKKLFFRVLAEETLDDEERKKLLYISSPSGKQVYNLLRDHYCSIIDILSKFPSCKPSAALMIEYLSPLLPRFYSVSRSFSSKTVSFVFNVFRFPPESQNGETETEQEQGRGLCTGTLEDYILSINPETRINIFQRIPPALPFNLRPQDDHVVLIANGTGFAPFLGFLQDLQISQKRAILIYGHRNHQDGIYTKEIQEFVNEGTISKYIECLSRVESSNGHYKYVQDSILAELSPSDLEKSIFICGYFMGSRMISFLTSMTLTNFLDLLPWEKVYLIYWWTFEFRIT